MQRTISSRLASVLVALVLVLCFHTPSQGQTTQDSTVLNKALQFSLAGSSGVGLQYWLSNNHAVFGGVFLSTGTQISSAMNNSIFDPFANLSTGVFAKYNYYFFGRRQFAPFIGFGGNISWRQSRLPNAVSYETALSLGLSAGLECFILPWLSIAGQYGIGVNYSSFRQESPIGTSAPFYSYIFNSSLGSTGITVAIYF